MRMERSLIWMSWSLESRDDLVGGVGDARRRLVVEPAGGTAVRGADGRRLHGAPSGLLAGDAGERAVGALEPRRAGEAELRHGQLREGIVALPDAAHHGEPERAHAPDARSASHRVEGRIERQPEEDPAERVGLRRRRPRCRPAPPRTCRRACTLLGSARSTTYRSRRSFSRCELSKLSTLSASMSSSSSRPLRTVQFVLLSPSRGEPHVAQLADGKVLQDARRIGRREGQARHHVARQAVVVALLVEGAREGVALRVQRIEPDDGAPGVQRVGGRAVARHDEACRGERHRNSRTRRQNRAPAWDCARGARPSCR